MSVLPCVDDWVEDAVRRSQQLRCVVGASWKVCRGRSSQSPATYQSHMSGHQCPSKTSGGSQSQGTHVVSILLIGCSTRHITLMSCFLNSCNHRHHLLIWSLKMKPPMFSLVIGLEDQASTALFARMLWAPESVLSLILMKPTESKSKVMYYLRTLGENQTIYGPSPWGRQNDQEVVGVGLELQPPKDSNIIL